MGLEIATLRTSFELVLSRQPNLTHRFYDHLFAQHPEVRPMFSRHARDRQEKMLSEALVAVMDHLEDAPWLTQHLGALGSRHVDYEVTDEMYGWVGQALLTTLAEVAGDAWTPRVEVAWTQAYGAIASLMKQGARATT